MMCLMFLGDVVDRVVPGGHADDEVVDVVIARAHSARAATATSRPLSWTTKPRGAGPRTHPFLLGGS